MALQKTSYRDILFSSTHLGSPFKYQAKKCHGLVQSYKLDKGTKARIWLIAIILAIPTLCIGSVASIYLLSAAAKYNKQKPKTNVEKVIAVATKEFCPRRLQRHQTVFNHIPADIIPPAAAVPAEGSKVGIPNIGNTCWLNTLLKFLASDNSHDVILERTDDQIRTIVSRDHFIAPEDVEAEVDKRINLRDHLRFIINNLRATAVEGKTVLDPQYVEGFVELFHSCNDYFGYNQCDSTEALGTLTNLFDFSGQTLGQAPEIPVVTNTYQNSNLLRDPDEERNPLLAAAAASPSIYDGDKIDLDRCISNPTVERRRMTSVTGEQGEFIIRTGLINEPESLTVQVGRAVNGIKYHNKVKMDDNLNVNISIFERTEEGGLKRKHQVIYQIAGAILHIGTAKSGHYVFLERARNGFFCHNDSRIEKLSPAKAKELFEKATTFKLKKVEVATRGASEGNECSASCAEALRHAPAAPLIPTHLGSPMVAPSA